MVNVLSSIQSFISGVPLITLIMVTGIFLTLRLRCLQVRRLPKALKFMVKNEEDGEGEITSFGALCTALSATIGTGNIVGVATAIAAGGPGALFWMILAAFFGMATKYSEGVLAVKYRVIDETGHSLGGPFYYIENGMGKKWKWLAKLFAFFGVFAGLLGIGTITQVNGISSAVNNFFDSENKNTVQILGNEYSWTVVITAIVVGLLVGLVLIGGIKRISKVSEFIVPFMAILYVVICIIILILNAEKIPGALAEIVQGAFGIRPVVGGTLGTLFAAMQNGVARGIFSNESGLGSAPIAAAAAITKSPARQGLVSMTGTFIDTIIICTMTGLTVVITGAWKPEYGLEGVDITIKAFQEALPFDPHVSSFLLMVCLIFFAFTTILGWDYYSERCLEYLSNKNMTLVKIFRWLYIAAVFIGPFMTVSAVWITADIFNALMALPNLVALLALNGVIVSETKKFNEEMKNVKSTKVFLK